MFVTLTQVINESGKSRPWFVGNPSQHREGALNHYRKELEGTIVQYPEREKGYYLINLEKMKAWLNVHGLERF